MTQREEELARRILELERENRELKDAVRARDDFIAIAAHELRNPMTPIYALVERLADECAAENYPPQLLRGLTVMRDSIEVFVARATMLLDVTRLTSGVQLHPQRIDLAALVGRTVQRYRRAAERVGSTISVRGNGALLGHWDPVAVQQILDNLLSNAIKYGDGGPITVMLDRDRDRARLAVADRGSGISACDQARIFARFEQVVRTRERSGFGVGLWVVHQLVKAMQGDIAVAARAGEGSTFTVTLPTNDLTADEDA